MKIDQKLFAHILNDPFLLGSVGLQGHHFAITIGYLSRYLNNSKPGTVPQKVESLNKACSRLVIFEKKLGEIKHESQLDHFANELASNIRSLKSDEYLLFPGGWAGASGHAMVYQFHKGKDSNLIFSVNNSGAGLKYHEKKSQSDKEKYNPVLSYKIPQERLNDKNLSTVLKEIIRARVFEVHKQDEIYNEDYLYQQAFSQWGYLDGFIHLEDHSLVDEWLTAGQISGTCTQRSLHQMIKQRFPNQDSYRHFIYNFKFYALKDYYNQVKRNGTLQKPKVHAQIEKGILHCLRLLLLNSTQTNKPLFSPKTVDNESKQLLTMLSKIRKIKASKGKLNACFKVNRQKTNPVIKAGVHNKATIQSFNPEKSRFIEPYSLLREKGLPQTGSFYTDLNALSIQCSKLQSASQHHAICELLEAFFNQMPLPDGLFDSLSPYYSGLDTHNKIEHFLEELHTVQGLYFSATSSLIGKNTILPNTMLFKLNVYAILGHINANQLKFRNYMLALCMAAKKFLDDSVSTVFLTNYHPALDKRLSYICTLFQKALHISRLELPSGLLFCYQSLLNNYPNEKNYLSQEFHHLNKQLSHDFIKALQHNKAQELWVLFEKIEQDDSILSRFENFKIQKLFEVNYASLQPLFAPESDHSVFSIKGSTTYLYAQGPANNITLIPKITKNVFDFSSEYPTFYPQNYPAIERNTRPESNQVQLTPAKQMPGNLKAISAINPEVIESRELFHLKSDSSTQVLLTLEYYIKHIDKLSQAEHQKYLEANLFEPGLLADALDGSNHAEFFRLLDTLVEKGIKHFFSEQCLLNAHSLALIRLQSQVMQYAYEHRKDSLLLKKQFRLLTKWIEATCDDEFVQAALHGYRFELVVLASDWETVFGLKKFNDLLTSYFYVKRNNNSLIWMDSNKQFRNNYAAFRFSVFIMQHPEQIKKDRIITLLQLLHVIKEKDDVSITGKFPTYEIRQDDGQILEINIAQGLLYKESMTMTATPLDILRHPLFERAGLVCASNALQSIDRRLIEVKAGGEMFRIIRTSSALDIQKQFRINGKTHWFQLAANSDAQANFYQISNSSVIHFDNSVPDCLHDCHHLTWLATKGQNKLIITNETMKLLYKAYGQYGKWTFQKIKGDAWVLSKNSATVNQLAPFESSRFIIATDAVETGGIINILLPRYQITMTQANKKSPIEYVWQGRRLVLSDTALTLAEGLSPLTFEDKKGQMLLFPVQPFVAKEEKLIRNEYYLFEPDTDAILQEKRKHSSAAKKDGFWYYWGTESFLMINVRGSKPYPETSEQALFLTYQYLGVDKADKALAVLNDCEKRLGGLKGSFQELQFLSWIINHLPALMNEQSDEVKLSTPQVIACQLKALSLVSKFKFQGYSFEKKDKASIALVLNDGYHHEQQQAVQDFENSLNTHVYQLFSTYQKILRDLPSTFHLSMRDRKSLLDFYHRHTNNEALGALGYEWVELSFDYLKREQIQLKTKSRLQELSEGERERLIEIKRAIAEHNGVNSIQSKLVYKPVSTRIADSVAIKYRHHSTIDLCRYSALQDFEESITNDVVLEQDVLTLDVSEKLLVKHFKSLLKIANDKNHSLFNKLLTFYKKIIVANRHVDLNQQPDNKVLLCYILHSVCAAREKFEFKRFSLMNIKDVLIFAKAIPTAPIPVPELVDDASHLLTAAKPLWKKIQPQAPGPEPEITVTTLPEVDLVNHLSMKPLKETCEQFRKLLAIFESGHDEKAKLEEEADLFSVEETLAGIVKFDCLTKLQNLTTNLFNNLPLKTFKKSLLSVEFKLNNRLQLLEENILKLANQGPKDVTEKLFWSIDIAAKKKNTIDIPHLVTLYFHNDANRYQLETQLSGKTINSLHTMMAQYLIHTTELQQLVRTKAALEQYVSASSTNEEKEQAFQLAKQLFANNLIDYVKEPALAVLQYMENALLYGSQKSALDRLLNQNESGLFDEVVEKVIMGGGKSKVIAPSIAKKKADGSNLVILEVPPALLRTNFVDLQAASARLFDQRTFLFHFDRDSDCSPERLKELYTLLSDVMLNKDYIVTTGISLQSLELKYFELLHQNPRPSVHSKDKDPESAVEYWHRQITGLERLLKLFKNRGDVLIDEVHQGLLLKKKLNFTLGDCRSIPPSIIRQVVKLYEFLNKALLPAPPDEHYAPTLLDAIRDRKLVQNELSLTQGIKNLAFQLTYHPESPLSSYIATLASDCEKEALRGYLLNSISNMPQFILSAPRPIKDQLALYKQQLSCMLPYTLKGKHGENYGPSQNLNSDPCQRACAIPYKANNVPSERSRFGNILETINYTIQSLLIQGLSKELLMSTLEEWLIEARQSILNEGFQLIDDTPIAQKYKALMQDESAKLSSVNLKDDVGFEVIYHKLKNNDTLIFEILKEKVLPQIQNNTLVLHSDAYNHVDMVRTCQGMSGTPWNHSTYHQRLRYNNQSGLGTDAYIVRAINRKKPDISSVDFTNTEEYLDTLLSAYTAADCLRALIDISASFKGIDNLTVAHAIASYIKTHAEQFSKPDSVKYVLFFNEQNELSALNINQPEAGAILIGSSSESVIYERLGVRPEKRFTFYSQAHAIGVDIKQDNHAKAIITLDADTHLQSFEQGALRMRSLIEGAQSIDLVVTTPLANRSFHELCVMMADNESKQLKSDHFYAAIDQMRNQLRTDLKERLFAVRGEGSLDKKHNLFNHFQSFFINENKTELFAQYGSLIKDANTSEILNRIKTKLLNSWQKTLTEARTIPALEEVERLNEELEKILTRYIQEGMCYEIRSEQLDEHFEVEVEQLVEVEVEKEIEYELFDANLVLAPYQPKAYLSAVPVNNQCVLEHSSQYTLDCNFDTDLLMSRNFQISYKGQINFLNYYLKPVHAILWEMMPNGRTKGTLLSQQEIQEVKTKGLTQYQWLGTTQHTVLQGSPPENYRLKKQYQKLIEQIRYFNGEFQLLLEQQEPFYWINHNFSQKMAFFNEYLLKTRETTQKDVHALKAAVLSYSVIFKYIAEHPRTDFTETNWEVEFPDIQFDTPQAYNALAKAFVFANQNINSDLLAVDWVKQFNLEYRSKELILRYIQKIEDYKTLLSGVINYQKEKKSFGLLQYLNTNYNQLLHRYFSILPNQPFQLIEVVTALVQFIPEFGARSEDILNVLLYSGEQSNTVFSTIKELCRLNHSFIMKIMESGVTIPADWTEGLLSLPQNKQLIEAFAKYKFLDKSHLTTLFNIAKTITPQPAIINASLDLNITPTELFHLIDDYKINFIEMNAIMKFLGLIKIEDKTQHVDLLRRMATNADSDEAINEILRFLTPEVELVSLSQIEAWEPSYKELIYFILLNQREISPFLLKEIAASATESEIFDHTLEQLLPEIESSELLNKIACKIELSSKFRDDILSHTCVNADTISILLEKEAMDSPFIEDIASHPQLSTNNIDKLLTLDSFSNKALTILLNQGKLNLPQMNQILKLSVLNKAHLKTIGTLVQQDQALSKLVLEHEKLKNDTELKNEILEIYLGSQESNIKSYALDIIRKNYSQTIKLLDEQAQSQGYKINLHNYQIEINSKREGDELIKRFNQEREQKINEEKNIFYFLLNDLENKANELNARKGKANKKAGQVIQDLVTGLKQRAENYFISSRDPKRFSTAGFCNDCKVFIHEKEEEGELKLHRKLFGKALAVLNNILKFLKQLLSRARPDKFITKNNRRYKFFDAGTDSKKLIMELEKNLVQFIFKDAESIMKH